MKACGVACVHKGEFSFEGPRYATAANIQLISVRTSLLEEGRMPLIIILSTPRRKGSVNCQVKPLDTLLTISPRKQDGCTGR